MLDLNAVFQKIDVFFSENRGPEAELLMKESIAQAVNEQNDQALLMLLNELMGYYRETSKVEESYELAQRALHLMQQMGLEGTIPYATTLLNIANAYRAGGNLQGSLTCYEQTMEIYKEQLDPNDMLVASLWNNLSLLYQEMQEFGKAKTCLEKALEIVVCHEDAWFELAVTHTNLASTCLALGSATSGNVQSEESESELVQDMRKEAGQHLQKAISIFEEHEIEDAHYSAALSSLGTLEYRQGNYEEAAGCFQKAMECMKRNLGENEYYDRLKENLQACEAAMDRKALNGMELCRQYYEACGKKMIHEKFPAYEDRIAVGLVGEGSDCFGYDDVISRDHDWGPDLCLWITEETAGEIGEELQKAYEELPREFMGYTRKESPMGKGRRGVQTIGSFYTRLLGAQNWEQIGRGECAIPEAFWQQAEDPMLAAAVNGQVFYDPQGIFSQVRKQLQKGYPANVRLLKLAQSCAAFSQNGQYNYARVLQRGDDLTAFLMLGECLKQAAKIAYYLQNLYPPHDKWLMKGLETLENGRDIKQLIDQVHSAHGNASAQVSEAVEGLAAQLAWILYQKNVISTTESYLDAHIPEILTKAGNAAYSVEELAEKIARLEFQAFDQVRNVGGRADCQNDWFTFSIMRKSQYLTWSHDMLLQYLYEFGSELGKGRNMITEKYGRMMESTAPLEYEQIKAYFPALSQRKREIIEAIVKIQVQWMEEFEKQYPALAQNARSIHTSEDHLYNTSYETYLRGEISTYSDKMLELYGRYILEYAGREENLARAIMENSVKMYGYNTLQEAQNQMSRLRI